MAKYRPIIVGCGKQGVGENQEVSEKIINFADAFSKHEGFDKICFVDQRNIKAIEAMEKYGGWATTIRYACEALRVNVAVVATPDDTHYTVLKELANCSLKLVICEKPLCTNLNQAREIVELYKAKGIPLMVNYTRRYLPEYNKLKEYGKPIDGVLSFNRGWLHTASHGIDFFEMLGLKDYQIRQIQAEEFRIWDLTVYFDSGVRWNEQRIGDSMPVWSYYDYSHWHVIDNAFNFLEGKAPIKCTGEDALKTLEICYRLMEGAK